jgi:signal transduction histidine kinase
MAYLWNIGARHVEVNLDHRFTNLGFSVIRQFCHRVILDSADQEKDGLRLFAFDKLLDLCLLVETDAFIEKTTRCDLQVFQGVEDRLRSPALVIGGNIKRLQKGVGEGTREYRVYETLMAENQRLERMVTDIKTYMEFFSEELHFRHVRLREVIREAVESLQKEDAFKHVTIEMDLALDASTVTGDPKELEHLFYCLIRNGMEAADPADPLLRISSCRERIPPFSVEIEIFNKGAAPRPEEIDALFSPFYSTKAAGTGFGLPMAKLIVRKHYGKIRMEPIPGEGTKVIVSLPKGDRG